MRQFLGFVKWLVVLAIFSGLAFLVYAGVKINSPFKTSAQEKVFTVSAGRPTKLVALDLESQGLIDKAFFFELFIYFQKSGERIQAGDYLLSPGMSVAVIAKKMTSGAVVQSEVRFTVIEGWSMADIGTALEEQGLAKKSDFLRLDPKEWEQEYLFLKEIPRAYQTLEGYLFPDTYLLAKDATPSEIAKKMIANFDQKIDPELEREIADSQKSIREIVILASIIEREVGRNLKKGSKLTQADLVKMQEERRLVASVFYNRINISMALESDATISYITGRKGSARANIDETRINSPYNTYKYTGLPPGPISNPSLDSIMAAAAPASSDYLFFLTAPDGTAYFAETLEGHIENRAKYLQ